VPKLTLVTVDAAKLRGNDKVYYKIYANLAEGLTDKAFEEMMDVYAAKYGIDNVSGTFWGAACRRKVKNLNDNMRRLLLLAADDYQLPLTVREVIERDVDPDAAVYDGRKNGSLAQVVLMLDDLDDLALENGGSGAQNPGFNSGSGSRGHEDEVKVWVRSFYRNELNKYRIARKLTWQEFWAETLTMWRERQWPG